MKNEVEGKVWAATHLCDKCGEWPWESKVGEPLGLDKVIETLLGECTVKEVLLQKHPQGINYIESPILINCN